MIAAIVIIAVVLILIAALLALRSRNGLSRPGADPHTHARDTTDPTTAADQTRSQGNSGGI